jgi:hypothetical protein
MSPLKKRPVAVLHIRKLGSIHKFIAEMRYIALMIGNNTALYPSPFPSIATFTQHIDELEEADTEASTGTRGKTKQRDVKYNQVRIDVHALQNYIQVLADNAETYDDALVFISKSGFGIKQYGVRILADFEVRNTDISGKVKLIAKRRGKYSSNEWQMSDDQTNWVNLPSTMTAKTYVSGLKTGLTKYFRHRSLDANGESNWSQIVSIMIT